MPTPRRTVNRSKTVSRVTKPTGTTKTVTRTKTNRKGKTVVKKKVKSTDKRPMQYKKLKTKTVGGKVVKGRGSLNTSTPSARKTKDTKKTYREGGGNIGIFGRPTSKTKSAANYKKRKTVYVDQVGNSAPTRKVTKVRKGQDKTRSRQISQGRANRAFNRAKK